MTAPPGLDANVFAQTVLVPQRSLLVRAARV
jgi:hypothetical protein